MSFKITPEVLKKLEELSKTRVSSGLTFGEDKEFYVIDARIGFKPDATISSLTLAVSEDLKSIKLYTFSPFVNPAIADNIINLLKDGKILKIKCKVYGNRIIAITNVEVIENIEITPNIIGVLRRTRDGSRIWIDVATQNGVMSYLVSDFTIKGAKLCAEGVEGMKILALAHTIHTERGGIVQYIHYQIVEEQIPQTQSVEMESKQVEEMKESIEEVETEEITEEIETTTEEVEPKLTTVGNNEGITVEVNNQVTTVETLSTQQQNKFDNVIEKMFNIYEQLREDDPFRRTLKTILDKLMNDDLYSKCSKVNSIEDFINCIVDNALVDKTNVVKNIVKTKLLNLVK